MKRLDVLVKRGLSLVSAFALCFALSVCAFATEGGGTAVTADTVLGSLTTGLTSAQGYTFQGINNALPLALALAGVIIAVTIGWRIFKRMSRG